MNDVTYRAVRLVLDLSARRGVPSAELLEGLPLTLEQLNEKRGFVDWDLWVRLAERLERRCGGPSGLEQLGIDASKVPLPHEFKRVARLFWSTRRLYHLNSRWAASADFRCLKSVCEDVDADRVRVTMTIPSHLRGSTAVFRLTVGVLRGIPLLVDQPQAQLVADVEPHRAICLITLPRPATLWARLRRSASGPIGIRTAFQQLGEQEQELAEQNLKLRESELRWRTLAENAPCLIVTVDASGAIESVNRPLFGVGPTQVVGRRLTDLIAPESREALHAALGDLRGRAEAIELELLSGELPPCLYSCTLARLPPEDAAIVMLTDITARKEAEKALQQSEARLRQGQKMEAIGRLAGGIAHDFNNLLSVMMSYSSMLLGRLEEGPDREMAAGILRASESAATLTRQLLAFNRQAVITPTVTGVDDLVSRFEGLLRRLVGEAIEVRILRGPSARRVKIDCGQMEQVLMNLAANSRDAMPGGGTLTIETADADLDELYVAGHPEAQAGRHAMISVSDTGCGIAREDLARVFEPFMTTKGTGLGTGLGLASVRGIVQQSGGSVWLYSEVGVGTTVKIFLPETLEEAAAVAVLEPERPTQGTESIVLVEDDAQVRAVVTAILQSQGYRVRAADGPAAALALFDGQKLPVDLLLTDVIMPGMNGRQLAERLKAERPALKVLFMSGYAESTIVHGGIAEPGVTLLQKPFSTRSLSMMVRGVLDA